MGESSEHAIFIIEDAKDTLAKMIVSLLSERKDGNVYFPKTMAVSNLDLDKMEPVAQTEKGKPYALSDTSSKQ